MKMADKASKLPVHDCVKHRDLKKLTALLESGLSPDEWDKVEGTPLCEAARVGHKEIVELLLSYGAKVNLKDNSEHTPLHYSAQRGHKEIVELLIEKGADIDAAHCSNLSPLLLAKIGNHTEVASVLSQAKSKQLRTRGADTGFAENKSSTGNIIVQSFDDKSQTTDVCTDGEEATGPMIDIYRPLAPESGRDMNPGNVMDTRFSNRGNQELATSTPRLASAPQFTSLSQPSDSGEPVDRIVRTAVETAMTKVNSGGPDIVTDGMTRSSSNFNFNFQFNCSNTTNHNYSTCYNRNNDNFSNNNNNNKSNNSKSVTNNDECTNKSTAETSETMADGFQPPACDDRDEKDTQDRNFLAQSAAESSSPTRTASTSTSTSTTTSMTAAELSRRLESQAGYMEKMVQSCVAGQEHCQDETYDQEPGHHGGLHVPVNVNLIYQPRHVEVWSAKQVNCEKADVENAEMVPVQSAVTVNYAARTSSDEEDIADNTNDDKAVDYKEIIYMEEDEKDLYLT